MILECNICHHKFQLDEDYRDGFCPDCKIGHYYWDSCFYDDDDESDEIGKEYNRGYYWSNKMVKIMKKENLEKLFSDESFIGNVCLSYRHDFGLMNEEDKEKLKFQCKEWMRSIINNIYDNSSSKIQYAKNGLPFMYPHLEEDKIFNDNFDVIEKYVKEQNNNKFGDFGTPKSSNYPIFMFEYNGIIHPTYYDFTFKNALFRYCWVEPYETYITSKLPVIRYRTGSYYVIFDYEKEGYGDYKL